MSVWVYVRSGSEWRGAAGDGKCLIQRTHLVLIRGGVYTADTQYRAIVQNGSPICVLSFFTRTGGSKSRPYTLLAVGQLEKCLLSLPAATLTSRRRLARPNLHHCVIPATGVLHSQIFRSPCTGGRRSHEVCETCFAQKIGPSQASQASWPCACSICSGDDN